MHHESFWTTLRLLTLSGAVAFAAVGPPPVSLFSPVPVAVAGDEEDEDDDDDDQAEEEGRVINGQVLGIYDPATGWSRAPGTSFDETTTPGLFALRIGQTGNQIISVALYNPHLIAENGVRLGDHVSIDGEFTGGTFYGTDLEITDRCC